MYMFESAYMCAYLHTQTQRHTALLQFSRSGVLVLIQIHSVVLSNEEHHIKLGWESICFWALSSLSQHGKWFGMMRVVAQHHPEDRWFLPAQPQDLENGIQELQGMKYYSKLMTSVLSLQAKAHCLWAQILADKVNCNVGLGAMHCCFKSKGKE